MSKEQAEILDLGLAWKRVKEDLRADRVFVKRPHEQALVESDLAGWLEELSERVATGRYSPSPIVIVEVPKGKYGVRPGGHLPLEDQVVYAAAVGACLEAIRGACTLPKGRVDYSYGFTPEGTETWLVPRFRGWTGFREQSLRRIRNGVSWVIVGDISACYENIILRTLVSDLRTAGAPKPAVDLLSILLSRWAQGQGRGIPQGFSASDILAKLYLSRVDEALAHETIEHLRYVDDFRVFCASRADAKRAILVLARLLRARGLNLQAAKTAIHRSDQAQQIIAGVFPTLKPLGRRYIKEVAKVVGRNPNYLSLHEAEELLKDVNDEVPASLIRHAYSDFFLVLGGHFDKSLFHYLLNRLAAAIDPFAVAHCLSLLESRPEETDSILRYVGRTTADIESVDRELATFLASEEAVYHHQRYQVVAWRVRITAPPAVELTNIVRTFAKDGSSPEYVRLV
ncbi:MAG TPA: RNA-directed DNA polymerase, partial [Longimicrobium sp.]